MTFKHILLLSSFIIVTIGSLMGFSFKTTPPCINIYYDLSEDKSYWMGKTYATFLQNLLGHFPKYQQIVSPIERYKQGDIEKCHATFYVGSYFNNSVPAAFFEDFGKTSKQVVWLGYNIWNFKDKGFEKIFGYEYAGLTELDKKNLDAKGQPTFYKDFIYKGETFFKYGKRNKANPDEFLAPFEISILKPSQEQKGTLSQSVVLSKAVHNGTREELPYILQNKNRFYVADVPFSYAHEADRYLIFADILFDILKEQPVHNGKYAFLRLEDIHPLVPLPYLYSATQALIEEKVPIHLSLIPIFFDPLEKYTRPSDQEFTTISQVPEFLQFIKEMKEQNAVMIWHGVTHQLGEMLNPHTAVSGDDFEFWDAVNNRILPEDSVDFVFNRLEAGFYDLEKVDIFPKIWLTPHYQASPLNYYIFARVFPWNVGRVIYFNHHLNQKPSHVLESSLLFAKGKETDERQKQRRNYFEQFKIEIESDRWSGQLYPYEIYGDVYGQRLLPENIGNSQPNENSHVVQPRTPQEIIADAKRNLVLRDAWASFFYHVQLMNVDESGGQGHYPGDPSELRFLVKELKKLGYNFINLETYIQNNTKPIRPEPIYVQ